MPWFQDLVILLTLFAFAVGQTVFDILVSNPDLLVARRVSNAQLLAVVAAFGLLPAIAISALWTLCHRLSPILHRAAFGVLVFLFSLAVFWQVHNTYFGEAPDALQKPWLWAIPSAALGWWAWRGERGFRSLLLALSPAIVIFPALFLFRAWRQPAAPPPIEASAQAKMASVSPNGTPVFLLVFDELGLHVLLNEEGGIDAERYPNFARLAAASHWFRNATSNSPKTITSIASIVTGNLPQATDSTHAYYPNTIFSLLAASYDIYIEEVGYTGFCDSEAFYCLNDATGDGTAGLLRDLGYLLADRVIPERLNVGLPDTSHTWGPFESAEDWTQAALARSRRVLHALDALGNDRFLFFAHLILPHSPYTLTPEGETYALGPYALDEGQDPATLASLVERYRMQVRFVDRYLGQFLERLKQRGLYDPALLIVTGDHGVSWKPEAPGRRLREENAELMLSVPLLVKLPFQNEGFYSEKDAQHIDLAPTIAEVLEAPLPFPAAGRSILAEEAGRRPKVAFGDDMERFEFEDRLALRPVETRGQNSALIGTPIDAFAVIEDESVRGKLEVVQIAPAQTPDFAAALPIAASGWAVQLDAEATLLEIRAGISHEGERSLAFQGVEGGASHTLEGLTPGSRYRAHALVRAEEGLGGSASLRVHAPGGDFLEVAGIELSGEFQRVALDFLAPQAGPALLALHYQGPAETVYWDDVSVRRAPADATTPNANAEPDAESIEGEPETGEMPPEARLGAPAKGEMIANGGFEEALASPWSAYGKAAATAFRSLEVAVTLNGTIIAATRPGAERWDVAGQLLSPNAGYLRCGWSVSIAAGALSEGENRLDAYLVLDPVKRVAVRLDSGWPRILVKRGDAIDRILP